MLYEHNVTDFETLSLPNRISTAAAIALAQRLVALPQGATAADIEADPLVAEIKARQPVKLRDSEKAHMPVRSGKMFNRLLANNFINGAKMMPNVRRLAEETANAVRQRFGIRGLPDDVKIGDIASYDDILRTADEVSVGGRATVEDMREGFIQSALKCAVRRIANSAVRDYLVSIGHDLDDALQIASLF